MNKIIQYNLYMLKLLFKASPSRIFISVVLSLCNTFQNLFIDVYFLRYILNQVEKGRDFTSIISFLLLVLICQFFFQLIWNYYNEIYIPFTDQKIKKYFMKMIFSKAKTVDLECYENNEFFIKYTKSSREAVERAIDILNTCIRLICRIYVISSLSLMFLVIDPAILFFALMPFVVNLFLGKKLSEVLYQKDMEIQNKSILKNYVNRVFFLREYAKELRISNINKVMLRSFKQSIEEISNVIKKYGIKAAVFDYILTITKEIIVFLGVILYSAFCTVVKKTMLLGDCLAIINSINSVSWSIRETSDILQEFNKHSLYVENFKSFIEFESKIVNVANPRKVPGKLGEILLKDMSFRYSTSENYVLKKINMQIKSYQKVAVVGNNGAGKTTLVKLLMRLYEPTAGQIYYDNITINQYDVKHYRSNFGVVFQDTRLFALNVVDNVLLKDDYSDSDLRAAVEAMKISGIYDRIKSSPNGIYSNMTKEFDADGVVLSQGEAQKVALARVHAGMQNVVILDEPSSSLDPIAEYEMYNSMREIFADRTVIFISHRLSSASLADYIYLLDKGEIIEEGRHVELLKEKGKYFDMWEKQSKEYRWDEGIQ